MMHLPPLGESKAMRIKLVDEDEQQKNKFLVMAINASRSSGKSTFATWLCYFDEERVPDKLHGRTLSSLLAVVVYSPKRAETGFAPLLVLTGRQVC